MVDTSTSRKPKRGGANSAAGAEGSEKGAEDNLEALYDADELDDQFATKADKVIQNKDIPERLQIRIAE